jgi:hypothetical protein
MHIFSVASVGSLLEINRSMIFCNSVGYCMLIQCCWMLWSFPRAGGMSYMLHGHGAPDGRASV